MQVHLLETSRTNISQANHYPFAIHGNETWVKADVFHTIEKA